MAKYEKCTTQPKLGEKKIRTGKGKKDSDRPKKFFRLWWQDISVHVRLWAVKHVPMDNPYIDPQKLSQGHFGQIPMYFQIIEPCSDPIIAHKRGSQKAIIGTPTPQGAWWSVFLVLNGLWPSFGVITLGPKYGVPTPDRSWGAGNPFFAPFFFG